MPPYVAPAPVLALLGGRGRVLLCHPAPDEPLEDVDALGRWFWLADRPLAGVVLDMLRQPRPEGVEVERVLPDGGRHPGRLFVHRWRESGSNARILLTWYPDPRLVGAGSQEVMRRFLQQVRLLLDRARGCAAEVQEGRSPGQMEVLVTLLERAHGLLGVLDLQEDALAGTSIRE